jgi:hypothetical protein
LTEIHWIFCIKEIEYASENSGKFDCFYIQQFVGVHIFPEVFGTSEGFENLAGTFADV